MMKQLLRQIPVQPLRQLKWNWIDHYHRLFNKGKLNLWLDVYNDEEHIIHKKANSYLIAFLDLFYTHASGSGTTIKDTGGTDRTSALSDNNFRVDSGLGNLDYGIILGTGTTPVTLTDYQIETIINHGNGSGELSYSATGFTMPYTSNSTRQMEINRTVTNNSGASITVNEVALYGWMTSVPYYICFEHSLSSWSISNGGNSTVTYKPKVTV